MKTIRRLYRKLAALYRWDLKIVCEESVGMGSIDYHDYMDDEIKTPSHGLTLQCERCGKRFDC